MARPGLYDLLKLHWGYDGLKDYQILAIESIQGQQDTIVLLPTGSGKSLCFQLPALMARGMAIVVSPLIALMDDQVMELKGRGVKAAAIHSGQSSQSNIAILKQGQLGELDLLYLSPERLLTARFMQMLPFMDIQFIAVDEAHCISQWGHDFRPIYLQISQIRDLHPSIPIMALTATATTHVIDDIQTFLKLRSPKTIRKSLKRENILINIVYEENKSEQLAKSLLDHQEQSSIIYTRSREGTEKIAKQLALDVPSLYYHAGLDPTERSQRQSAWMNNHVKNMVATTAFGMGINKADVRKVYHVDIPSSLEEYVQEIGRAGRDGHQSEAILYYHNADIAKMKSRFLKQYPPFEELKEFYTSLVEIFKTGGMVKEGQSTSMQKLMYQTKRSKAEIFLWLHELVKNNVIELSGDFLESSHVVFRKDPSVLSLTEWQASLIKAILRFSASHRGRYFIDESQIANYLSNSEEEIKSQLQNLVQIEIVDYHEVVNDAKIVFNKTDVPEEAYLIRRLRASDKMESMIEFIKSGECRQQLILAYFGEEKGGSCDKCDNCLRRIFEANLDIESFRRIITKAARPSADFEKFIQSWPHFQRRKVVETLGYLESQGVLEWKDGLIKTLKS